MLNRRTLLKAWVQAVLWHLSRESWAAEEEPPAKRFRVWDQHSHLGAVPGKTPEERAAFLVKCMDRVGVERLIISQGYSEDKHPNPPEQFTLENNRTMQAAKAFPDRIYGSVYITPALLDFSMKELDRCVHERPDGHDRGDRGRGPLQRPPTWIPLPSGRSPMKSHPATRMAQRPGQWTGRIHDLRRRRTRQTPPQIADCMRHLGGNWEYGIRIMRATNERLRRTGRIRSGLGRRGNGRPRTGPGKGDLGQRRRWPQLLLATRQGAERRHPRLGQGTDPGRKSPPTADAHAEKEGLPPLLIVDACCREATRCSDSANPHPTGGSAASPLLTAGCGYACRRFRRFPGSASALLAASVCTYASLSSWPGWSPRTARRIYQSGRQIPAAAVAVLDRLEGPVGPLGVAAQGF